MPIGIGMSGGGGSQIASGYIGIYANFNQFNTQFQQFNTLIINQARQSGAKAGKTWGQWFAAGVRTKISAISASVARMATATVTGLLTAGTVFAGWGVKIAAEMERAEMSMQVLLKSVTLGTKMFEDIRSFAKETPFEFTELRDASKLLLAYGFTAKEVMPWLKRLGDVSGGTGASVVELAETLGRFRSQGRVYANDIREITRFGIPLKKLLAEQFGVSIEAMSKIIKDGKVTFTHVAQAFKTMTNPGGLFFGFTDKLSKALSGQLEKLHDVLREIGEVMGKGLQPAVEAVTQVLLAIAPDVEQAVGAFAANFTVDRIFKWTEYLAEAGLSLALEFEVVQGICKQLVGVIAGAAMAMVEFEQWFNNTVHSMLPYASEESNKRLAERNAKSEAMKGLLKPFANLGYETDENGDMHTSVGMAFKRYEERMKATRQAFANARRRNDEFQAKKNAPEKEPTWFDKLRDTITGRVTGAALSWAGPLKNSGKALGIGLGGALMKLMSGAGGLDLDSLKKKPEERNPVLSGGSLGFQELNSSIQSALVSQSTEKKIEKNTRKTNDLLGVAANKLGGILAATTKWNVWAP